MPVKCERGRWPIACLVALLLAGCGPAATPALPPATLLPADATQILASATVSQAPTAGPAAALSTAELSTSPLPTASAAREALQLVVLHSNDNWGETEPCG